MLFEITVLETYIQCKQTPPGTIDIANHWEHIGHMAEELIWNGNDRQDIAPDVLQLLDGINIADEVLDQWIE